MNDYALHTTLLDMHFKLSKKGLEIILAGGFGLYLKQLDSMSRSSIRTLLPAEAWPRPRSTSDLDLFFPLELLISLPKMQSVKSIIDEMKFVPVAGSEYWQFVMPATRVRIDLLTGSIGESAMSKLKCDSRRARPKGDLQLHVHPVPEAVDLSEHLESIPLRGQLSESQNYSSIVKIPSPFTYLMMKLTAFGDQVNEVDKNQGRHHALDVYRIVAMMTEEQFDQTKQQFADNATSPYVQRAKNLVKKYSANDQGTGILRMKEHQFFGDNLQITEFIESLLELMHI